MTAYHGGKQRIGKQLAEVIVDESIDIAEEGGFEIKGYCEPFCGMLGVYRHIPELFEEEGFDELDYLAGDANKSVIKMWQAAQQGWKPPTKCTKVQFNKIKRSKSPTAEKGFVGHACTYRGVFLDAYFDHSTSKIRGNRERVIAIAHDMGDVKFSAGTYDRYSHLKGYIIYCDPPYADTDCRYFDGEGYFDRLDFDTKTFWQWVKMMAQDNIVFVSEYRAPKDVDMVWQSGRERLYLI
jgi:site-specific DNA-adenine methylase